MFQNKGKFILHKFNFKDHSIEFIITKGSNYLSLGYTNENWIPQFERLKAKTKKNKNLK